MTFCAVSALAAITAENAVTPAKAESGQELRDADDLSCLGMPGTESCVPEQPLVSLKFDDLKYVFLHHTDFFADSNLNNDFSSLFINSPPGVLS